MHRSVIGLADRFVPVVQMAIAKNESQATEGQVLTVLAANTTDFKSGANAVVFAAPRVSGEISAKGGTCYSSPL